MLDLRIVRVSNRFFLIDSRAYARLPGVRSNHSSWYTTVPVIAFLIESPARCSLTHHDEIDGESDYSYDPLAAKDQSEAKEEHDKREGGWLTWLVLAVGFDIWRTKNVVLFRPV